MSQKILLDLAMKLSANSAELKRGIEESNRSLRSLNQNTRNIGRDVRNSFAQMAVAVAAAQQGFRMFESTLRASQKTNDYIDKQISGLTNGIGYLQTSIASLDFTDMQQGFLNAVAAGREFAEVMDEINDRARAVSWRSSDLDVDIADARLKMANDELSLQDRINAGLRAQQLLEQKLNDERGISEEKYSAIYNKIRDTYDVTDQQMGLVEQYLKNYDNLGDAGFRNVTEYLEKLKESQQFIAQMDRTDPMNFAMGLELSQGVGEMFQSLTRDEKLMLDVVQNLSDKLSDELRDSLADAGKEVNAAMIRTMTEMRAIQSRVSSLRRQAGSDIEIINDPAKAYGPFVDEWTNVNNMIASDIRDLANTAIDLGDWENPLATLTAIQERMRELVQMRGMMTPDAEGYAAINLQLEQMQERIREINEFGIKINEDTFEPINEALQESQQAFFNWQFTAESAIQSVANAFLGLAFGVDKSIDDIVKSLMRMIAAQILSAGISSIFNPIGMISGGLTGGFTPNANALSGGLNLNIPQLSKGALAYGPSIVQVGEYAGANLDPEIISKASDLRNILGLGGNNIRGSLNVSVDGQISGETIYLSNSRQSRRRNLIE